jgi:hypothetical protein
VPRQQRQLRAAQAALEQRSLLATLLERRYLERIESAFAQRARTARAVSPCKTPRWVLPA